MTETHLFRPEIARVLNPEREENGMNTEGACYPKQTAGEPA